ncbi:hypothetical protein PQX77_021513 [Marasmius sp. AFHP31]|nr:hypothetical protein PQX77_021513 [Marasmius sp. AFHP31]
MKKMRAERNGKQYFITCSGWKPGSNSHKRSSIPEKVSEALLLQLFYGRALGNMANTACVSIVPSRIGGKMKRCNYPHNNDGSPSFFVKRSCPAYRTIYVPEKWEELNLRVAVVIQDHTKPHNHPILPATKASYDIKEVYRSCVRAGGALMSTVQSIDKASSTRMIMNGSSPSNAFAPLASKRVKRDILGQERRKEAPRGVGLEGVMELFWEDAEKKPEDRYVHLVTTGPTGGTLIFTGDPFLLSLIHSVLAFYADTTFKRTIGTLQEWELVIWLSVVQRAVTISRIYTDKGDRQHFKALFDHLQQLVLSITGKPMRFKRLTPGGNLLCSNVDLELAQVLGLADSFLPTNVPEYSKINTDDPEEIVPYICRGCTTHVKRGIQSLKSHVTAEEYKKLIEFQHLKSDEELEAFDGWIKALNNKHVTAWWNHKRINKWILPTIIKSQSKMDPEDWTITESTTNIGEGQHYWSRRMTGSSLPLLTSILQYVQPRMPEPVLTMVHRTRTTDKEVAQEVRNALRTGILTNSHNTVYDRMKSSVQRADAIASKQRASRKHDAEVQRIQDEINGHQQAKKEAEAKLRASRDELAVARSSTTGSKRRAAQPESSSSGIVKVSKGKGKVSEVASGDVRVSGAPPPSVVQSIAHQSHESIEPDSVSTTVTLPSTTWDFSPAVDVPEMSSGNDFGMGFDTGSRFEPSASSSSIGELTRMLYDDTDMFFPGFAAHSNPLLSSTAGLQYFGSDRVASVDGNGGGASHTVKRRGSWDVDDDREPAKYPKFDLSNFS